MNDTVYQNQKINHKLSAGLNNRHKTKSFIRIDDTISHYCCESWCSGSSHVHGTLGPFFCSEYKVLIIIMAAAKTFKLLIF